MANGLKRRNVKLETAIENYFNSEKLFWNEETELFISEKSALELNEVFGRNGETTWWSQENEFGDFCEIVKQCEHWINMFDNAIIDSRSN